MTRGNRGEKTPKIVFIVRIMINNNINYVSKELNYLNQGEKKDMNKSV